MKKALIITLTIIMIMLQISGFSLAATRVFINETGDTVVDKIYARDISTNLVSKAAFDSNLAVEAVYKRGDCDRAAFYSCAEFAKRVYRTFYGVEIRGLDVGVNPYCETQGYELSRTNTPQVGDLVFYPKQPHSAIVKKITGNSIILIEQNWKASPTSTHTTIERSISMSDATVEFFRLKSENNDKIKVIIDGKKVSLESEPIIEKGRILVPIRDIAENIGCQVIYDAKNLVIGIYKAGREVVIRIGEKLLTVIDGFKREVLDCEVSPIVIRGRTFLPLRSIAEALACDVSWDGDNRAVVIETREPQPIKLVEERTSTQISPKENFTPALPQQFTPSIPVLNSSDGKVINVGESIRLTWSETGASLYRIEVINDTGTGTFGEDVVGSGYSFIPVFPGSYRWQIRPYLRNGLVGDASPTKSFTVIESVIQSTQFSPVGSKTLEIKLAKFGPYDSFNTYMDKAYKVRENIRNGAVKIDATDSFFFESGDPGPSFEKTLRVTYSNQFGEEFEVIIQEGASITLTRDSRVGQFLRYCGQ